MTPKQELEYIENAVHAYHRKRLHLEQIMNEMCVHCLRFEGTHECNHGLVCASCFDDLENHPDM